MSSQRRKISSRANGACSQGPVTPEGKQRSSMNALSHGLLARAVVLKNESEEGFQQLSQQFIDRFGPLDAVELAVVEEMVAASWRGRRAWVIENEWMDRIIDEQPTETERGQIAGAFDKLAETNKIAVLYRYQSRLNRLFRQALGTLVMLRQMKKSKSKNC
jgi:hypothetical protein